MEVDWKFAVTALGAILGYLAKYLNDLRIAQRKDRLDRVNRQLGEFYGPLLALTSSSQRAFATFIGAHPDMGDVGRFRSDPQQRLAKLWRLWIREVFMPMNLEIERIIRQKSDLIDEDHMPVVLLELCSHIAAYRAIVKRWDDGDFADHATLIPHPGKPVHDYFDVSFSKLKQRQNAILRIRSDSPSGGAP
jgi:hypothetical protein